MPVDITHRQNYFKYLIETNHPLAKQLIEDFNQLAKTNHGNNLNKWKTDVIKQIIDQYNQDLQNWSILLLSYQKTAWENIINAYVNRHPYHKLYIELNQFLSASFTVQLHFKDYCYYYNHHTPGVNDAPHVMNKRAEPIYHQLQLLEIQLIQIIQS